MTWSPTPGFQRFKGDLDTAFGLDRTDGEVIGGVGLDGTNEAFDLVASGAQVVLGVAYQLDRLLEFQIGYVVCGTGASPKASGNSFGIHEGQHFKLSHV
jgi:hypothetical protein